MEDAQSLETFSPFRARTHILFDGAVISSPAFLLRLSRSTQLRNAPHAGFHHRREIEWVSGGVESCNVRRLALLRCPLLTVLPCFLT